MRISLITVCFRSVRTLATTLESVLRQRDVDLDYIVVDGGSDDGTVDLLREYEPKFGGRLRWISEPDNGMYDAVNKGIRMATGDLVGLLNADDFFQHDMVLKEIAKAITAETDAVYADIRFVARENPEAIQNQTPATRLDRLRDAATVRYYSGKGWRPWMHNWGYMPPHPSVYIRRAFFDQLGGYRTDYRISADFELMTRFFCRNRLRLGYIEDCVVGMLVGGLSTGGWRSKIALNRENVRANRANGYFSCFLMMLPKYLFKIWGLRRV